MSTSPLTQSQTPSEWDRTLGPLDATTLGVVVLWAREEPELVGQIALLPEREAVVLGRGDTTRTTGLPRASFVRQRPGRFEPGGTFRNLKLSRDQLLLEADGKRLKVRNLGRCALLHGDREVETLEASPGEILQLGRNALLLVVERPAWLPVSQVPVPVNAAFGEPDPFGIVGESPAVWRPREQIAFATAHEMHVLVTGPSGTGKELVARAIHTGSHRAGRALVTRNAVTLPELLIDAELFGNARNYPNPGMPERAGLIGEADGSTLFLDEIGELPHGLQAHLLRVLDSGEYQRLGESRSRQVCFRLVAATNRPIDTLKHDLAARLPFRIQVPGLDERREDIPLILRSLLKRMLGSESQASTIPQPSLALIRAAVSRNYIAHVRELEAILWQALAASPGNPELDFPPALAFCAGEGDSPAIDALAFAAANPKALDPEHVQQILDEHEGHIEPTWRKLGLSSRHVLVRFISKHGLRAGKSWPAT